MAHFMEMLMNRVWAMPNKSTYSILPIAQLIEKWQSQTSGKWIDPFCVQNKYASVTNDLNPEIVADYHLDAIDFLKLQSCALQNVFFDPPYSPRQSSECYKSVGHAVNMKTTQSSWWANIKDEIARIVDINGICITSCWNSNGIGKSRGFEIEEVLLVAHGGWHNDTIVTVERKVR